MFYPIKTSDGEDALLNVDLTFCFARRQGKTYAIAVGGASVEVEHTLPEILADIELMDEDE